MGSSGTPDGAREAVRTKPDLAAADFSLSPYLVIWETTRACELKCRHCRAEAIDRRDPRELTRDEAVSLLREIRRFGEPLVVFTGGDPLRRPDIFDLVAEAASLGLRTALTPSGTAGVTTEALRRLKDLGLARLAVSLDGSGPGVHDAFRGVDGSFEWTLGIVRRAREIGLSVQINTTVSRHNAQDLARIAGLLVGLDIAMWSVFFLVPTGRGKNEAMLGALECERVFGFLADLSRSAPFDIKTTEAPQYRRVLLQTGAAEAGGRRFPGFSPDGVKRPPKGVNDGNGFVFVSHTGDIFPSGFLPLAAGNVRTHSLVDVYRHSPLFTSLRDASRLGGKCGACEFRRICGGSRARAYAVHGDPLAAEPYCAHVPKDYALTSSERSWW